MLSAIETDEIVRSRVFNYDETRAANAAAKISTMRESEKHFR